MRILVFGKKALHENRISGTVLMIQLTQNSPTCAYIGQNPLKRKLRKLKPRQLKPRYAGTRCICTGTPLTLACSAELWNYDKKLGLLEEPLKASAGI